MTLASPWFSPSGAFFGLARIMSAMDTPAFFFGGAKAGRFLTKRSIVALVLCFSGQWSGAVLQWPTARLSCHRVRGNELDLSANTTG